jgi:hypothetical protein
MLTPEGGKPIELKAGEVPDRNRGPTACRHAFGTTFGAAADT